MSDFGPNLAALAAAMIELMKGARGVGLAAPQVGQNIRLFVMNPTGEEEAARVYVNPVLTEAERTGLPAAARDSGPGPVLLVGALAMLLSAGAIFKLARRHTQSYRRDWRVVSRRPRQLRPGQKVPAGMSKLAARSNSFAGRSVAGARQIPVSVDPAHDIKASLRKVMDELQRVAA